MKDTKVLIIQIYYFTDLQIPLSEKHSVSINDSSLCMLIVINEKANKFCLTTILHAKVMLSDDVHSVWLSFFLHFHCKISLLGSNVILITYKPFIIHAMLEQKKLIAYLSFLLWRKSSYLDVSVSREWRPKTTFVRTCHFWTWVASAHALWISGVKKTCFCDALFLIWLSASRRRVKVKWNHRRTKRVRQVFVILL